jgi:hypothetical protein
VSSSSSARTLRDGGSAGPGWPRRPSSADLSRSSRSSVFSSACAPSPVTNPRACSQREPRRVRRREHSHAGPKRTCGAGRTVRTEQDEGHLSDLPWHFLGSFGRVSGDLPVDAAQGRTVADKV